MPFEVLDLPFVLFRRLSGRERSEVLPLPGLFVLLPRVQPIFAALELADHGSPPAKGCAKRMPALCQGRPPH